MSLRLDLPYNDASSWRGSKNEFIHIFGKITGRSYNGHLCIVISLHLKNETLPPSQVHSSQYVGASGKCRSSCRCSKCGYRIQVEQVSDEWQDPLILGG